MRKVQRTFIKNKKQIRKDIDINYGMSVDDYKQLECCIFTEWAAGNDYDTRRSNLLEQINEAMDLLSNRENQILQLLSQGAVEDQIASILHIDRSTVHNYRIKIQKKFEKVMDKNTDSVLL